MLGWLIIIAVPALLIAATVAGVLPDLLFGVTTILVALALIDGVTGTSILPSSDDEPVKAQRVSAPDSDERRAERFDACPDGFAMYSGRC